MLEKQILIPEGFIQLKSHSPRIADADFLLENYCTPCARRETCDMTKNLRIAMAENIPYWPEKSVFVTTDKSSADSTLFCASYEDHNHQNGIQRLIHLTKNKRFPGIEEY